MKRLADAPKNVYGKLKYAHSPHLFPQSNSNNQLVEYLSAEKYVQWWSKLDGLGKAFLTFAKFTICVVPQARAN